MQVLHVKAPRQRNTRKENKHTKKTSTVPNVWKKKTHKFCQKDVDARWTKKIDVFYRKYKNKANRKIRGYRCSSS